MSDMDLDDLMPMFCEEGREHLENLNLSLLSIERHTSDEVAVAEAFRAAHSLKGMAATMGFNAITRLTHMLEELLGEVRRDPLFADADLVSLLLRTCDALTTLLSEIETTGAEQSGVEYLCGELQSQRERRMHELAAPTNPGAGSDDTPGSGAAEATAPDASVVARLADQGTAVLRVELLVSERSLMPGARAFASLLGLERAGAVLGSNPARSVLEEGEFDGRSVTAWVATTATADALEQAARTQEIERVTISAWQPIAAESDAAGDDDPATSTNQLLATEGHAPLARARTVRVDAGRLDDLMHGVGELLVRRSRVQNLVQRLGDRDVADAVDALDRAARELQELVMDVRMVSVDTVLRMLPRMVRDLSGELDKDVRLTISGRDTELDRTVIDVLGDPLLHLVRNAIDHGIEAPDQREAAGKPRTGLLDVSATTEGGAVVIRVRDDGGGMQPDRIREVAVRRGVITASEAAQLPDEQALDLCFAAGFSTRDTATSVSGRGVGLDVVRASVRALGGDVSVESSDEGTIMSIRLPLTLAIRSVLLVQVAGDSYAIHTDRIGQTVDLGHNPPQNIAGRPTLVHLDRIIPLVDLAELLGMQTHARAHERARQAVLIEVPDGQVGVVVDSVDGQAEVVTRPLPQAVRTSGLLSASAVLGDGEVAFLINTEALVDGSTQESHAA